MKKILVTLLAALLLLSAVGCEKTPPEVPDNTENNNDNNSENSSSVEQLLSYGRYDVFEDEIYLCDDVYRSDDTPTHGTASIGLPMAQNVLELKDYDILLCGDGCSPESVVSRASQGYAPAYRVVADGEIDGNFKTLKFKLKLDEAWLNDIINSGINVAIEETLESKYFYLLVLDEKHYAYIHLERIDGVAKIEDEAELADGIVTNARINFEPKNEKLDLTIERVIRLAENKGEELTWSDFEMYNGRDIGSGLTIMNYEIDETFDLMVGGAGPGTEPMYIRLVTKADRENYIDIRTEDVEKFISENRETASSTEVPGTYYSEVKEISALPSAEENAIITGHTVGYTSRFYVFEPGLKCYRYDHGTEKYYEFILTLPSEYTDGEIISISSGGGSGEAEIITKAANENGATMYLGCVFFVAVDDPLYETPLAVLEYSEQELIDRGVIKGKESAIDWETINGEWYHGFIDANGYQFYKLAFDMKTAAMNFDYGYYESEYVNRYTGTFTIDPASQEITAVLHDDSIMHTDPDILIKFRLASSANDDAALVWKVLSCDVEKYNHLIGTEIEFSRNMPTILELSERRIDEISSSDSLGWIIYNGKIYVQDWNIDSEDLTAKIDTIQLSESLGYATNFVGYYQNNKKVNANDPNGEVYMVADNPDILCVKLDNGGIVWLGLDATQSAAQNDKDSSPIVDESLILVQSEDILFKPYENFVWAQTWEKYGWLSADGMRVSNQFSEVHNEFPSITYSDDFTIHYGDGVEFVSIAVYNSAFEHVQDTDNTNVLNELAEGTYYLVITVKKQGDYIESEDKYEYTGYECVYKFTIADDVQA